MGQVVRGVWTTPRISATVTMAGIHFQPQAEHAGQRAPHSYHPWKAGAGSVRDEGTRALVCLSSDAAALRPAPLKRISITPECWRDGPLHCAGRRLFVWELKGLCPCNPTAGTRLVSLRLLWTRCGPAAH